MSLRLGLLASALFIAPLSGAMANMLDAFIPSASAQPIQGVYLSAGAGWNHSDLRGLNARGGNASYFDGVPASRNGGVNFDEGWGGVAAVGWGFGNGLRAEIEGNYRENEVSHVGGFGGRTASSAFGATRGDMRQYGVMANAYYDFQLPTWFPSMPVEVVPYVGGGVGYMWSEMDNVGGRRLPAGNSVVLDDTQGSFAYQGIAGMAFPVKQVPGLSLTAEYRYTGALQERYNGRVVAPSGATVSRGSFEADQIHNHSVMAGVRYALYTPTPATPAPAVTPVVVSPQSVARTYLVFFDFDRSDLTTRARQIINEAASNAGRVETTRIEVAGHADRSGSTQYNQALSQRRADAVAAELARLGVSRSSISVSAYGETRPLVATGDGVREAQNRRVEIVLK